VWIGRLGVGIARGRGVCGRFERGRPGLVWVYF
jgi:hypothetical protein